tara:strand:- start:4993 stop:5277 length:285 start_codon:yes stop_codon:yes gene_type:complete
LIRKGHIATVLVLCGLSAMLGYRVARMGPPDPSGIVAHWAAVYAEETGRADLHCAGRPQGDGYVITCGTGAARVDYVTDAYGGLVARRDGGRDG